MNKRQRKKVNKKKQISKTVNITFYENENKTVSDYFDSWTKVVEENKNEIVSDYFNFLTEAIDDQTLNEKED